MAGITRFEEIEAWKTACELTNHVYAFTNPSKWLKPARGK